MEGDPHPILEGMAIAGFAGGAAAAGAFRLTVPAEEPEQPVRGRRAEDADLRAA
jgi:NADH:ubiquinone oxidoreductase subunit F (NADH-binding)